MKKICSLWLSLCLLMCLFSACSGRDNKGANPAESPEKDGLLRLAATQTFERSREGSSLVFDSLTRIDHKYHALPGLITAWSSNEDHTSYELTLRSGVRFHDGTPLTAEILKWNIEKGGDANYCSYSYHLKSVIVKDAEHLQVDLDAPYLYFEQDLALVPCLPVDAYTEEGHIKTFVGTGPFRYDSTDAGDVATLIRNEDYWDKDYQTDVKTIQWFSIPEEQTRKMALESGKVDAIGLTEHYISMPYTVIHELRNKGGFQMIKEDDDAYTSVGSVNINWKEGKMADVNLRRALVYAIDRSDLVKNTFFGIPTACGHVYNPKFDDGPRKEEPFTFALEKSREYLEKAGYTPGNETTPCKNKEGEELSLNLLCGTEEYEKDLVQYLQTALARQGIKLKVESLSGSAMTEKLKSGFYDLEIGHPWFVPLISCLGYMGSGNQFTDFGLGFGVNDRMLKASDDYSQAPNQAAAQAAAAEMWKTQYEEVPSIPLFADLRYVFHNEKFSGFHFDGNVFRINLNGVFYQR